MDTTLFFGILTTIYCILYFFDRFFKSCMHYPYDAFLRNTGLSVNFLCLNWHTTAFNRLILRWGSVGTSFIRNLLINSFTVGVLFSFLLLPVGIILLIATIFGGSANSSSSSSSTNHQVLKSSTTSQNGLNIEIMLPGVNLPLGEIGYYIIAVLISTMLHELGHALAAVMEDVPVTGFGFKIVYCLPVAYTEFSSDHLNALKWFRKLRILCAGIWHNFLCASFCYMLFSMLGLTTAPFFAYNQNVIVTEMTPKSPLRSKPHAERGIQVGNVITQINGCEVLNEESWYHCLATTLLTKTGYCISSDFIRLNDESMDISHHNSDGFLQCCDENNPKLCCFEYIEDFSNDAPLEIPQHVCLDVRKTVDEAYGLCAAGNCVQGFCLRPLLRNTTTILDIKRKTLDHEKLLDVVYIGHPLDVTRTVRVSSFVPKQTLLSSYWPDSYALLLKYNVVFSLGLAFINAIPCYGFDGAHITNTIVHSFLVNRIGQRAKRELISFIITSVGTILMSLAMLRVVWSSLLKGVF